MKYSIQTLWPQFHQETLCFWKQEQMLLPNTEKNQNHFILWTSLIEIFIPNRTDVWLTGLKVKT